MTTSPSSRPEPLHRRGRHLTDETSHLHAGAIADDDERRDRPVNVVERRVVRLLARDRDVPRVDGDLDVSQRLVHGVDDPAVGEGDLRQAVGAGSRGSGKHVRAGEARDERVGRRGDELGRCPDLPHAAFREGSDAIGENGRIVEVVRHEQDGKFELVE